MEKTFAYFYDLRVVDGQMRRLAATLSNLRGCGDPVQISMLRGRDRIGPKGRNLNKISILGQGLHKTQGRAARDDQDGRVGVLVGHRVRNIERAAHVAKTKCVMRIERDSRTARSLCHSAPPSTWRPVLGVAQQTSRCSSTLRRKYLPVYVWPEKHTSTVIRYPSPMVSSHSAGALPASQPNSDAFPFAIEPQSGQHFPSRSLPFPQFDN
jgi:hypothetical protein